MNTKVQAYIVEQLAFAGFCVITAGIAFLLRPDIWATRLNVGGDFTDALKRLHEYLLSLPGAVFDPADRYRLAAAARDLQLAGSDDWCLLATRSTSDLHNRIEQIVGLSVTGLRPWAAEAPAPAQPVLQVDGDPIPGWPCIARTEALRKAGIPDETYRQPARFAPPLRGRRATS